VRFHMLGRVNWSFVERLFKCVRWDYRLLSGFSGIAVLIILLIFGFETNYYALFKYEYTEIDYGRVLIIISNSILIAMELSGIMYFISQIRRTSKMLDLGRTDDEELKLLNNDLNNKFTRSMVFWLLVLVILIPLIIMDIFVLNAEVKTCFENGDWPDFISLLVYSLLKYFEGFLLVLLLWIIINFSLFLDRLAEDSILSRININIYNGYNSGILNHIRDVLGQFTIYFYSCVFISIISYYNPVAVSTFAGHNIHITVQMLFYYSSVDLLGVLFLIRAWISMRRIFKSKWQILAMRIDSHYHEIINGLLSHISLSDYIMDDDIYDVSEANNLLDILQKEKERLRQIDNGRDIITQVGIIGSILGNISALWLNIK